MPPTPFTALVFDFDGTLAELTIDFDLLRTRITALAEAMLDERPEPSPLPVLEWLDELACLARARLGRDAALELHCRGRLIVQATELDAARHGLLFDFARPVLERLSRTGVATAVITRNSTAAVRRVFPDIADCCGAFLAREDAPELKPRPGHLLAALDRLGVAPDQALMIGDHFLDIQTGQGAGCRTAAVATGRLTEAELERGLPAPTASGDPCPDTPAPGGPTPEALRPDYVAPDVPALLARLESEGLLPPA